MTKCSKCVSASVFHKWIWRMISFLWIYWGEGMSRVVVDTKQLHSERERKGVRAGKEVPNSPLLYNIIVEFFSSPFFSPTSFSLSTSLPFLLNLSLKDKLVWWFCLVEFSSGHEECDLRRTHKHTCTQFWAPQQAKVLLFMTFTLPVLCVCMCTCEGMCVFSVLMPPYQDTRCPRLIELYKIKRKALCENNPSSQHYNKSFTFHAVSWGSIMLHCCSRQQKYIKNIKARRLQVLKFGLQEEKLIMNRKAVGFFPGNKRDGRWSISKRAKRPHQK